MRVGETAAPEMAAALDRAILPPRNVLVSQKSRSRPPQNSLVN